MKSTLQFGLAFVAMTCLAFGTAVGQEVRPDQDRQNVQQRQDRQERAQPRSPTTQNRTTAGRTDEKTGDTIVRVSQLMGMNIQNNKGESVGEIEDIVLDCHSGKVSYAAVSYGGFLGIGDKLFAVPFEAFQVKAERNATNRGNPLSSGDYVLVLNVTQEQLEGQEGFDEDNWPNLTDSAMTRDLDKRYGVNRDEDEKDRLRRQNRNR